MQHQSLNPHEEEAEFFDGQPGTDSYSESRGEYPLVCRVFGSFVKIMAYILAALFVVLIIFLVFMFKDAGKPTVSDIQTTFDVPLVNQSNWIIQPTGNLTYPPWVLLTLDFSVDNPNNFDLNFETSVDMYAYDYKTENSTAYSYMDTFVFEKRTFDRASVDNVHLVYNLTRVNLLQRIGLWIKDRPSKNRDIKLTARSGKLGVGLIGITIDLDSITTDSMIMV